jgi:hypothetical protein
MLAHNVYFSLIDASPTAQQQLLEACRKYLAPHQGIVWVACGTLARELNRPVNDRDFDVGLHILFASQADHDAYQVSDTHLRFIDENKANWKKVRVFDSVVKSA